MDKAVSDRWRQGVGLFGAVFQVLIGVLVPVGSLVNRDVSLIIPAGWAFAIWGPIFLLCGIFAVYQLLPSRRYDPLLRSVGWPLGIAFVGNFLWTLVQPLQQPILSQVIIFVILVFALTALLRFARFARFGDIGNVQRWLVGLPAGLLAGWLTAANVVGFNDMLVRQDVIGSGTGAAFVGAGLLVVGAVVAALVVRIVACGPAQATVMYAVGVLWGLFGVASNQYDTSIVTTGAAVVCFVALVVVLVGGLRSVGNRGNRGAKVA